MISISTCQFSVMHLLTLFFMHFKFRCQPNSPRHLACVSFTEAQTSCLWCLGREAPGLILMPNFWKAQVPSVKCAVLMDNLAYPPLDFKSSPSFLQYLVDRGSVDNDLLFKEQWQDTKVFIYSLETWIFPQMFWICSWLTSQMCACRYRADYRCLLILRWNLYIIKRTKLKSAVWILANAYIW